MSVIYRYLMIIVACVSLLIGLQVPSFVDQYQKRVDAHLREVIVNLQPFVEIATKYFDGDMEKLLALHRNSEAQPFKEEGKAIEQMLQRKTHFEAELSALNTDLAHRALHVLLHSDQQLREEALAQYSYTVPLDIPALSFGAGAAIAVLLIVELLMALLRAGIAVVMRLVRAPAAN
ncbi:MAG: DUF2937 family protein [Gallionella sp.]|nr:DUF2937 family protein [Gallionella sp.]